MFQVSGGNIRKTRTNRDGVYTFRNLLPGLYSVSVEASGFESSEISSFKVVAGAATLHLNIILDVAPVHQAINVVSDEKPLSIEPEGSASNIALQGSGLAGLPDNPGDFAAAVQALAGPSVLGPTIPQLFVNGFLNNQLPPKETIREIHINDNPFSAENDRPGTNRIEAVTKAGNQQIHGEGYLNWDAGWWDASNPFTRPLPPNPARLYGGNIAGPITERATAFVTVERNEIDFKNAVNATLLSPSLLPSTLVQNVADFETRLLVSPQLDLKLNKTNTMTVRYSLSGYSLPRNGIGGTSLPEAGYKTTSTQQTGQITETAVLSPQLVDETKVQFVRTDLTAKPLSLTPAIVVDHAFTIGSYSSQLNSLRQNQWELQNNLSRVIATHTIRMGVRFRGEGDRERVEQNQAGTFTFLSGLGPALSRDNTPVLDDKGALTSIPLSALERYRRTVLFSEQGLSPSDIRLLGGGTTSFSINGGNPNARLTQYDFGVYFQESWHVRSNLLLGAGLRYERQTNLHDRLDFGPRLSFAWAPATAAKQNPHTVVRGGFGVFYQRLDPALFLPSSYAQSPHVHYTTSDLSVLNNFPVAPPLSTLTAFATPADTVQVKPNIQTPATLQATLSLEQELPWKTRVSVGVTEARTYRDLLLVDAASVQIASPRALLIDSNGQLTQHQLKLDLSNRLSKRVNVTVDYVLNKSTSNTDGTIVPVATWDNLAGELGRSANDIRHNLTLTGSVDAPWGVRLSPFVVLSSGRPFNIVSGLYPGGDIPYTQRPVLAADPTQPGVVVTPFGAFLLNPLPGDIAIARNYGSGPAFLSASFRLSKTFAFGKTSVNAQPVNTSSVQSEHRYGLVASAQVINFTNHLNPGIPEGNLSSSQFGQASSLAPGFNFGGGAVVYHNQLQTNRRIEGQIRFTF